jgi:hypothetical protein
VWDKEMEISNKTLFLYSVVVIALLGLAMEYRLQMIKDEILAICGTESRPTDQNTSAEKEIHLIYDSEYYDKAFTTYLEKNLKVELRVL